MADHRPCTARNETPLERADRNFGELLQELRVTQTGVQILFAFLLTLAFTQRFPSLDTFQRATYVITLLLEVLAADLFTAPAALHRSLFQRGAKARMLLVVDVTTGRAGGVAAGAATLLVCLGLWGLLPRLVRRAGLAEERRTAQPPPAPPSAKREVVRPRAAARPGASPREPSARLR